MTESAFNRPVPVQEQQAARTAEPKLAPGELPEGAGLTTPPFGTGEAEDIDLAGLDTVSRGAILDGLRENPITEMLNAPNPLAQLAHDFQAREEAALHSHARELTEAEATKALEAVMQERIKEALDRDIDTRARYEGTIQGNPVVSDPSTPPGIVGAVRLTAEQLEATKHLQPGEAWAKAGQSLEPEPPAKVEDLDEF